MYYKLSNIAKRKEIEETFELEFKYPNLYNPQLVVNGYQEDNLYVVTNEGSNCISMAIWGLMPQGFNEDWSTFQNVMNTLSLSKEAIAQSPWIKNAFETNRCLILVTGFFTYFLQDGETYPYYVSLKSQKPFFLAGIYTQLEDGFLSCALLTTEATYPMKSFHNINNQMPLAIPESIATEWLSNDSDQDLIQNIVKNPPNLDYRANPIAKEFFTKDILYKSILQPVYYDNIPEGTR